MLEVALATVAILIPLMPLSSYYLVRGGSCRAFLVLVGITSCTGITVSVCVGLLGVQPLPGEWSRLVTESHLAYIIKAVIALSVGIGLFSAAFSIPDFRVRLPFIRGPRQWDRRVLLWLSVVTAVFTLGLALSIAWETPALGIVAKRTPMIDSVWGIPLGYLRLVPLLAQISGFVVVADMLSDRSTTSMVIRVVVVLSIISSLSVAVVMSSRTPILVMALGLAVLWIQARRNVPIVRLVVVGALLLVLLTGLGTLRGSRGTVTYGDVSDDIYELVTRRPVVTRTASVMAAVDGQVLKRRNGTTLGAWLTAPVPRAMWKNKPVVSIGQVVGEKVYGHYGPGGGVPPGTIGELYWNFGWWGIILGMLSLGIIFGALCRTLEMPYSNDVLIWAITGIVLVPVAYQLIGGNISSILLELTKRSLLLSGVATLGSFRIT